MTMTERDWLDGDDVGTLLLHLPHERRDRRKLTLFACACFRRVANLLPGDFVQALDAMERSAEGMLTRGELDQLLSTLGPSLDQRGVFQRDEDSDFEVADSAGPSAAAMAAVFNALNVMSRQWAPTFEGPVQLAAFAARRADGRDEAPAQLALLRDVLGNPFRPVPVAPSWLSANNGAAVRLAQTIYLEGRFADLPVLADALEEAGCSDRDVLGHCRQPGLHTCGCWVVDALLGKG
jgi:hypothetical protein